MGEQLLLREIEKVPAGEWIVLSSDESRLVSHHPDLREALKAAEQEGVKDPVIMRAAQVWNSFIIAH